MEHQHWLTGDLPYSRAIKKILEHDEVSLKIYPKEIMTDKDYEINDKTALKNIGIILDREGKFVYKEDPTPDSPPPVPEGGYTLELLFNKLCSMEHTSARNEK